MKTRTLCNLFFVCIVLIGYDRFNNGSARAQNDNSNLTNLGKPVLGLMDTVVVSCLIPR